MPTPFPVWTTVFGFIIGAFIGSFLNMAIWRLPRKISFINPSRSFCPKCEHSLSGADLMPILSWVFSGGKCRYCKDPVSSRYFWVEILTGALFAGTWWRYFCDSYEPVRGACYLMIVACLVAIIFIDAELFIIPDELNAFILMIAIVYRWSDHSLMTGLWGGLLGWGLLWGVQLLGRVMFGKDAMGDGDIKMMRSIGVILGPWLLVADFGIAVVLGLVFGLTFIAIANAQARKSGVVATEEEEGVLPTPTPIPFMLLSGVWYLLCLDVVAVVVPALDRWISARIPGEIIEEEDDWKPTATTIPFGPYLAAGALVAMLFAGQLEHGLTTYFRVGGAQ